MEITASWWTEIVRAISVAVWLWCHMHQLGAWSVLAALCEHVDLRRASIARARDKTNCIEHMIFLADQISLMKNSPICDNRIKVDIGICSQQIVITVLIVQCVFALVCLCINDIVCECTRLVFQNVSGTTCETAPKLWRVTYSKEFHIMKWDRLCCHLPIKIACGLLNNCSFPLDNQSIRPTDLIESTSLISQPRLSTTAWYNPYPRSSFYFSSLRPHGASKHQQTAAVWQSENKLFTQRMKSASVARRLNCTGISV